MNFKLGDRLPDFEADSTLGTIKFYDYIDNQWGMILSHAGAFAPVCTTELAAVGAYMPELEKRGVKVLSISCDDVESHKLWIEDIESFRPDAKITYPILSDPSRELAERFGILDPQMKDFSGKPLTARAVLIVGPDKRLKLSILYPASTGRCFKEVLRVIDSLQLTEKHKLATAENCL